jgi:hypothetical protein
MTRALPALSNIRFTPASEWHRERGLLGFIRCVVDGALVLDSIALRRTLDNSRLTLSFPEREDGVGRRHPIIRPIDDEARRAIEKAIIESLGWTTARSTVPPSSRQPEAHSSRPPYSEGVSS